MCVPARRASDAHLTVKTQKDFFAPKKTERQSKPIQMLRSEADFFSIVRCIPRWK
jgi:hypothetical protein